jgi:fatty acid desaturase
VRVRFPWPFRPMVLGIMEHHAHHQAPGVPLYNLPRMQQALEKQTPLVTWQFSWRAYVRVCRRCKLYDYDAGRWVAFDRRAEELAIPEKTPVSVRGVVTRP